MTYSRARTAGGQSIHDRMMSYLEENNDHKKEADLLKEFIDTLDQRKNDPIAIRQLSTNDYNHLSDILRISFSKVPYPDQRRKKCLTLLHILFNLVRDPGLIEYLVSQKPTPVSPTSLQLACLKDPDVIFKSYLEILLKLRQSKIISLDCLLKLLKDTDFFGKNIFHTAADTGNKDVVEALVNFTKAILPDGGDELLETFLNAKDKYRFIPYHYKGSPQDEVNVLLLSLNPKEQKRQADKKEEDKIREEELKRHQSLNTRELELNQRLAAVAKRERELPKMERVHQRELEQAKLETETILRDLRYNEEVHRAYETNLKQKIDFLENEGKAAEHHIERMKREIYDLQQQLHLHHHAAAKAVEDSRAKDEYINSLLKELKDRDDQQRNHWARFSYSDPRDVSPKRRREDQSYPPVEFRDPERDRDRHPRGYSRK